MKNLTYILRLGLAMLLFSTVSWTANAQTAVVCPQNIDFSFGNFNNWLCYTAQVQSNAAGVWSIYNVGLSGPVGGTPPPIGTSRHVLTTGTGTDYYGGFPEVAPGGGIFSSRIGNDATGAFAERIRYTIHVPAGFNNYSFNFRYAVVFEDPGTSHQPYEKPSFSVIAFDSTTNDTIHCASASFVAGAGLPGFQTSGVQSAQGLYPLYLPWTLGNLNLSAASGKTVYIDVTTADCTLGGHFGYGYFDVISCGQFNATISYCDLKAGLLTLSGPPGYQKYEWWNQNFTARLNSAPYSNQTVNVTAPTTCQYYNLVLTPYASNGCPDTIRTKTLCDFRVDTKPDSVCNTLGKPILMTSTVTGGVGGFTYKWTTDDPSILSVPTTLPYDTARPKDASYITLTVTDSNGCFRQDTVKVQDPSFHVALGPDLTTCIGTPINLNPGITPVFGPGYIFNWTTGPGLSATNVINPTFTPSSVGTNQYVLRVDSGICATSDTMNITTLPNSFATLDTAVCEGEDITLQVQGDPAFKYFWTNTTGAKLDFATPPTATSTQTPGWKNVDTTTTFTITAKYPTCPDIVKQLTVRVEPIPRVFLSEDTIFKCLYQPVFVSTAVYPTWFDKYTYAWRANDFIDKPTSPIIIFTGDVDTTLRVTVRTPLGCRGRDSVRIHVFPGNFGSLTPSEAEMCPHGVVTLSGSGGVKYRWNPSLYLSDATSPVVTASPVSTTEYALYVTDKNGCVDTVNTVIKVHPEATVSMPDSVVLYPGESYQLNPQGNLLYYSWFPTVGLSPNASVSNPVATPTVNTRYYLNGTTEAGCKLTDSIFVLVKDESAIGMANAFSPGSEPNATFKVSHLGTASLRAFRIYNRWGVKVFETSDINQGWDGTFNGTPQPMGVYIYTVEALSNSGKPFSKQGNVTVFR